MDGLRSVHVFEGRDENIAQRNNLEPTCELQRPSVRDWSAYVFVPEVLQKLQLSIRTLGEDWSAERLHDLLDSNILVCQLVACRAIEVSRLASSPLPYSPRFPFSVWFWRKGGGGVRTRQDQMRPCRQAVDLNTYISRRQRFSKLEEKEEWLSSSSYLEVISKVVPKIWARTNSAIFKVLQFPGQY